MFLWVGPALGQVEVAGGPREGHGTVLRKRDKEFSLLSNSLSVSRPGYDFHGQREVIRGKSMTREPRWEPYRAPDVEL